MKQFSELCECVSDQCAPQSSGASVYVGLEHIDSGVFFLKRHGSPCEVQSAKSRFCKGDILYGKLRPYLDKAVIAPTDGICSTDILVFRAKPDVRAAFLLGLIHTQEFLDHSAQTTNGVNHPRTSWPGLSPFAWDVPGGSEQDKIAAVLWKIQRAIEAEEKLTASARELKQAVMRQLFTHGLRGDAQKETDYGAIPEPWTVVPLSECCEVQTGVAKGRKVDPREAVEVPYLRVANVQDGHLDLREMKTITLSKVEVHKYLLQDGDVVLTEGGDFDKLGRGFIWRAQVMNCAHQNHVFAVRANRSLLLPDFLAYLVQSPYGRRYFLTVAHKTTNLACINTTKLKALPVPLPQIDEQREIAWNLQNLDRKVDAHGRKLAALQDLFKTLLHTLMTGEIRVADLDIDVSEVTH